MNRIYFAFGVHAHQPVGNKQKVFEECYKKSYEPFFKEASNFPGIILNVHISGSLMEWLVGNRPEFIELLSGMINKGQVELLGGPFYEAILPIVRETDITEQILMYSKYLADKFGVYPRGAWLPERVWEPYLAKPIAMAGMEYTLVDDSHFHCAGWMDDKLHGYFITEHEGFKLKIIPIIENLRYRMPYGEPSEIMDYLKEIGEASGGGVRVMMDDVEKFGVWPNSWEHVYGKGQWLVRFFKALSSAQDKGGVSTVRFSEYLDRFLPDGNIYLPAGSYSEMGRWSLPYDSGAPYSQLLDEAKKCPEDRRKPWMDFIRGGFFRNMLTKYPESNLMHKKMMKLSRAIDLFRDHPEYPGMQRHLFRGQCNCAYWHGMFGGIYMRHLRAAIFHELLECEKMLLKASGRKIMTDRDDTVFYGQNELQVSSADFCLHFHPVLGGGVSEFSEMKSCHNIGFVMRRRPEIYHSPLLKPGIAAHTSGNKPVTVKNGEPAMEIIYDWYDRFSFITHFLHPGTRLAEFSASAYGEQGDFVNQPFSYKLDDDTGKIVLERDGHIWHGMEFLGVKVTKIFSGPDKASFSYTQIVENHSGQDIDILPGVELNLCPSDPATAKFVIDGNDAACNRMYDGGGREVILDDAAYGIKLKFTCAQASAVWMFPVYTVSRLESGLAKMFQGTSVLFHTRARLSPGRKHEMRIDVVNE